MLTILRDWLPSSVVTWEAPSAKPLNATVAACPDVVAISLAYLIAALSDD